jgi:hypothetical protein
MKFHAIAGRLTGLGCPVFGISHHPSEADVAAARRVLRHLEDCWVLYGPSEMETPAECVNSVLGIREFLFGEIGRLRPESELGANLRAMRAACRKFLDAVSHTTDTIIPFAAQPNHYATWVFTGALGELRGVFGVLIARLAAQHGLDVEDALAIILPAQDLDGGT